MSDLKSAWEIAQEKAKKLGKLSHEEVRQQREEQCRQIGAAIAQRYLDNPEPLSLRAELNKHSEEEQVLVKRAILGYLIQAMDLSHRSGRSPDSTRYNHSGEVYLRLEKIVQGIASLEPTTATITGQISQLCQEYEGAIRKTKQEIERKSRETLHQLRISGTAVADINIEATPQWQQSCHKLIEPFQPRLDSLKQELINTIVGSGAFPRPKDQAGIDPATTD